MQDKITKQNKKTCEVAMYGTVTVGSKGQIVIPKDVRTKLGIESGESLIVLTKGKAIWLVKSTDIDEIMAYIKEND